MSEGFYACVRFASICFLSEYEIGQDEQGICVKRVWRKKNGSRRVRLEKAVADNKGLLNWI